MISHHLGQLQNPNPGSKRRRRKWSLSSSLFSLGGSTGKRVSLLFAMLNFVSLLQYRNLMSQATSKQHDNEWMVGSYHSIDNADIKRKPRKTRMTTRILPTDTNGTSSDAGLNTIAPEILVNATKVTSQQRGQHNQRNNRSRNDTDESVAMRASPSSRSTQTNLHAKDLVTLLENFQPRATLKPFLPQSKMIENDINSSSSLQERDDEVVDTRKWAYAFLLGGARSDMIGTEYIAGLYSVVASAHQLRKLGSRADIILMVQIAAESPHQKLSEFEEEILQKMNIRIVYIPKFANASMECFYSLMMEKFRILKLTDYSRVMYLDYDVMPTCNLDYLFDLSDPLPESSGLKTNSSSFRLKENVILAYRQEPSTGGLFVVKPNLTDYDHIQRIIHEKETRSLELPYPHWDPVYGWGHAITPPDYWKDVRQRFATNWTWYGVEADQGLLYYWTKYVKKSVSIIIRDDVEQWDSDYWDTDTDGSLVLRRRQNGQFPTIEKKALKSYGCPITGGLLAPYNDFVHLTGRAKPWYQTRKQLENPDCTNLHENECKVQAVWYSVLKDAMDTINVLDRFSWDFIGTMKGAPLGHAPNEKQIAKYLIAKKKRNWNQYRRKMKRSN